MTSEDFQSSKIDLRRLLELKIQFRSLSEFKSGLKNVQKWFQKFTQESSKMNSTWFQRSKITSEECQTCICTSEKFKMSKLRFKNRPFRVPKLFGRLLIQKKTTNFQGIIFRKKNPQKLISKKKFSSKKFHLKKLPEKKNCWKFRKQN